MTDFNWQGEILNRIKAQIDEETFLDRTGSRWWKMTGNIIYCHEEGTHKAFRVELVEVE